MLKLYTVMARRRDAAARNMLKGSACEQRDLAWLGVEGR